MIEQKLQKDLLRFACCHQINELLLHSVFTAALVTTSGPNITLFKRFQALWEFLDRDKYETGDSAPDIAPLLADVQGEWFVSTLSHIDMRGEYCELLEVILFFLSHSPPRGIEFWLLGLSYLARWMAKVIYAIKM